MCVVLVLVSYDGTVCIITRDCLWVGLGGFYLFLRISFVFFGSGGLRGPLLGGIARLSFSLVLLGARWVPLSDLEHGVSQVCPEPVESYQSVSGPHPMTPHQTRVVSLTFMHAFISLSSLSLYNKVIVLYMSPGFWRFAG